MFCDLEQSITPEPQTLDLPEGVPPLTSFYLYLTSGCNLRCRHCWVAPSFTKGQPSPGEYLDPDLLKRAVIEAKPLGLCNAKLTGGEPLLHPRFVEIVDLLTAEDLSMNMETNGTLVSLDLARHLKDCTKVGFVSVSIDGPNAAVHDPFRGVRGSFDAAIRGFRFLVDAGYRPQLIMSPHRGNIQYVEEVVELALKLGAGSVKLNPVTQTGRGMAMHEQGETLGAKEIVELARYVRGDMQQSIPIHLIVSTPLALYTIRELARWGPDGSCNVRHILGILASGDMALCGIGQTIPELCFGNLQGTGVVEVWLHHPMLQQLRESLEAQYPGICGQCIHAKGCLTYCLAQNYQDTRQLVSPMWLCEEAYKQGLFPVGRLQERQ